MLPSCKYPRNRGSSAIGRKAFQSGSICKTAKPLSLSVHFAPPGGKWIQRPRHDRLHLGIQRNLEWLINPVARAFASLSLSLSPPSPSRVISQSTQLQDAQQKSARLLRPATCRELTQPNTQTWQPSPRPRCRPGATHENIDELLTGKRRQSFGSDVRRSVARRGPVKASFPGWSALSASDELIGVRARRFGFQSAPRCRRKSDPRQRCFGVEEHKK